MTSSTRGWSVVIEAHRFGHRDIVDAADLFEELADRALVPFLGVGVTLDALVVARRIPPADGWGRGDERLADRSRVAVPPHVAIEEPLAARTAQAERVVALDDPAGVRVRRSSRIDCTLDQRAGSTTGAIPEPKACSGPKSEDLVIARSVSQVDAAVYSPAVLRLRNQPGRAGTPIAQTRQERFRLPH